MDSDFRCDFSSVSIYGTTTWSVSSNDTGAIVEVSLALPKLCQPEHRMTLINVGRPITQFLSSKELVISIADAMEALDGLYFKADRLHRDISPGNIFIREECGMLIDWDICARRHREHGARQTGTWQFMSAEILLYPSRVHEIEDDRESALWVLLWTALNYSPHTDLPGVNGKNAADIMRALDYSANSNGEIKGGELKRIIFTGGDALKVSFDRRPQLNKLLLELRIVFSPRYSVSPDAEEMEDMEELRRRVEQGLEPEERLRRLRPYKFYNRLEKLQQEGWLCSVLRECANKGEWPLDPSKLYRHVQSTMTEHERPVDQRNVDRRHESEAHRENWSQTGSYLAALSGSELPAHALSMSTCESTTCLLSWDRTGVPTKYSFDYNHQPDLLARFFRRHLNSTLETQSLDYVFSNLSKSDQKAVVNASNPTATRTIYDIFSEVPNYPTPRVENPSYLPHSSSFEWQPPFSTATRATRVFDRRTRELVLMRTHWRPEVHRNERKVYTQLHGKKSPSQHSATFGIGNGVRSHVARTHGKHPAPKLRWQYRMTLATGIKPLTQFSSSKELVVSIADAMEALDGLYFKADRLHRDISPRNIFIHEECGMLIDWDMCARRHREHGARQARRTGTWQFISAKILEYPSRVHEIQDDRESALWVLLWTALNYSPHTDLPEVEGKTAADIMRALDYTTYANGEIKGGELKSEFLLAEKFKISFDGRPQLNKLVSELRRVFSRRYVELPTPEQIQDVEELHRKVKAGLESEARLKRDPTYILCDSLKKLTENNWLSFTLREYANEGVWPDNESPERQTLVQLKTTERK